MMTPTVEIKAPSLIIRRYLNEVPIQQSYLNTNIQVWMHL